MLHELDSEEVADDECDDFLEDEFVLPPEIGKHVIMFLKSRMQRVTGRTKVRN